MTLGLPKPRRSFHGTEHNGACEQDFQRASAVKTMHVKHGRLKLLHELLRMLLCSFDGREVDVTDGCMSRYQWYELMQATYSPLRLEAQRWEGFL